MAITRYFGMKKETDYGQYVAPTVFLDVAEVNITGDQNPESVPTMTFPGPIRAILGDFALSGSINTVADTDLFGWLLKAVCGQVDTVKDGGSDAWEHIFATIGPRANSVSSLESYSLDVGEDLLTERRIAGTFVPSLELSYSMGEPLGVVASVIAASEEQQTFSAPAVADHPADSDYIFHMNRLRGFVGDLAANEMGVSGQAPALEALTLNINNNPTDDWRKSNSRFLHNFQVQEQEITGSITYSFENITELKRYFGGKVTPDTTTPASRLTMFPLCFVCDLGVQCDDSNGGNLTYRLVHYMPSVYYSSYDKPQSKRDRATIAVGFKALIPRTAPDLDAITYNGDSVAELAHPNFTDASETARETAALYNVLSNGAMRDTSAPSYAAI